MGEEMSNEGHVAERHPSNFDSDEWFFIRSCDEIGVR